MCLTIYFWRPPLKAPLALRVPEGPQEAAALRERRALPALLDSPALLDRRETAAFPGSQYEHLDHFERKIKMSS